MSERNYEAQYEEQKTLQNIDPRDLQNDNEDYTSHPDEFKVPSLDEIIKPYEQLLNKWGFRAMPRHSGFQTFCVMMCVDIEVLIRIYEGGNCMDVAAYALTGGKEYGKYGGFSAEGIDPTPEELRVILDVMFRHIKNFEPNEFDQE